MKAIVLSGGGGKGAYEMGVWKAIRRLNIKYDIVTGTSIGALNGMFMAQREYYKCLNLWNNIEFNQIYENFDENNIYKGYIDKILDGGVDTSKIERLILDCYNPKKLYNSKIKYGIVSVNLSDKKPKFTTNLNTSCDKLPKYILASATCFPVFKPANIDGDLFIDGGYYDNVPINLAIELGANDIIAVDLRAVGFKKKVRYENTKITYIAPNNKLDSFLMFEKNSAKKMIKFGYNDTMKTFGKLSGNIYTFKKEVLDYNYLKYNNKLTLLAHSYDIKVVNLNSILEEALLIFKVDASKIYKNDSFNKILLNNMERYKEETINFELKNINKIFDRRAIVKNIYIKLINKEDTVLLKVFKKEFLVALYLMIIGGKYE